MQKLKDWILTEGWLLLLETALVAALAVALAHWTWVALTPRAVSVSSLPAELENYRPGAIAQRHLFGEAREGVAGAEEVRNSALRLKILGVFARGKPGAGRAILSLDGGKPAMVTAGEDIAAGIVLHEVHPGHVLVRRAGVIERVDLDRRAATVEGKPGTPRPAPK
jgi:general secretion pathway protein C